MPAKFRIGQLVAHATDREYPWVVVDRWTSERTEGYAYDIHALDYPENTPRLVVLNQVPEDALVEYTQPEEQPEEGEEWKHQ